MTSHLSNNSFVWYPIDSDDLVLISKKRKPDIISLDEIFKSFRAFRKSTLMFLFLFVIPVMDLVALFNDYGVPGSSFQTEEEIFSLKRDRHYEFETVPKPW